MKKALFYSLIILLTSIQQKALGQSFVTADVLQNTFYIRIDSASGTGFLIGKPDSNFMVTARHLLGNKYSSKDSITYYVNGGGIWEPYRGIVLLHKNSEVDIAVIKPNSIGEWNSPFNSEIPSMLIGEDVRFLGYPYNITPSRKMVHGESHYPHPILKSGMHNGMVETDSVRLFLFEGHNNSGFSGGPIFTKSWKQKPIPTYRRLVAVVTGFYPGIFKMETKSGTIHIAENSGIMLGTPAFYITEILEAEGYHDAW